MTELVLLSKLSLKTFFNEIIKKWKKKFGISGYSEKQGTEYDRLPNKS